MILIHHVCLKNMSVRCEKNCLSIDRIPTTYIPISENWVIWSENLYEMFSKISDSERRFLCIFLWFKKFMFFLGFLKIKKAFRTRVSTSEKVIGYLVGGYILPPPRLRNICLSFSVLFYEVILHNYILQRLIPIIL